MDMPETHAHKHVSRVGVRRARKQGGETVCESDTQERQDTAGGRREEKEERRLRGGVCGMNGQWRVVYGRYSVFMAAHGQSWQC